MTNKKYWTGAHTKHRLQFHLIFIPKYRHRVLEGKVAQATEALFYQACEVNRWNIHEMNVQTDHVHILIQIEPNKSITQVVQILKGGSSKVLRDQFPTLKEFLWGDSFWSDGYFAESVGVHQEEVIRKYIKNQ